MGKLDNKTITLRFVPTMNCNLRCSYCFLSENEKSKQGTMFDEIATEKWIEGMKNFSNYDVEFYMWGGEPFCINETFDLVRGFCEYNHVKWARIDHNMTKAEDIVEKCPSSKVKLNCSWHTERFSYEEIYKKALLLKKHDMVGMINFVASDTNLKYIKDNGLNLDDIIHNFYDEGIYFNVAADFSKGNDLAYKQYITKYMNFEDWDYIHGQKPSLNVKCDVGSSFFTVNHNGDLSICSDNSVVGDYFTGELTMKNVYCENENCLSITSYCHRLDNDFSPLKHLEFFATRNILHRRKTGIIK